MVNVAEMKWDISTQKMEEGYYGRRDPGVIFVVRLYDGLDRIAEIVGANRAKGDSEAMAEGYRFVAALGLDPLLKR